jgi:hypothetical protein
LSWSIRPGQGIGSTAAAAGVAIGDYDGDGRPDLFLTRPFGGNRLYRNLGDFRFKDVTASAGLTAELDYEAWGPASSTSTTENRAGRENRVLTLTLVGQTGNPTAVGAMVTVEMDRGTAQTFELHAGGSYLSQSTNTLFVGLGEDGNAERITVRWPDGSESTHNVEPAANTIEIEQPGR